MDYDSFYIIPTNGMSEVSSRTDVSLLNHFAENPIFSSPMKGISGSSLVIEMARLGCFGILHRFNDMETRKQEINIVASKTENYGIAIGLDDTMEIVNYALERGCSLICIDVANGYLEKIKTTMEMLKDINVPIMSGNVVTKEGAEYLANIGVDCIRVGIGGSKVCATRDVTGIGRNNLKAIQECSSTDNMIVADGGVDKPGKACKAFVAGADMVMLGSALAYAEEAENTGDLYGMASKKNHILNNKQIKSIEGYEFKIDNTEKKPLKEIIDQFVWGIKSSCTYLGVKHYSNMKYVGRLVPVVEAL